MNKIDILQVAPYPDWDVDALERHFTLHRYFEAENKQTFLANCAASVRGIATRGDTGASRDMIEALPNLEIISVYGVGVDAIDIDLVRTRGIRVTNTPDVLTKDVADLGMAMMLAAARGLVAAENWARSGAWAEHGMFPLQTRVSNKRVGILGLGRIGYEIAKRCAAFDMDIAYTDLVPRDLASSWTFIDNARELAERSDFLFVAAPGGPETRHLVDRSVIEAVGAKGMLINISRASNIDEEALLAALETGKLGFAALDVFAGEPNLNPRFLKLNNVLLQPHHASGTVETRKEMGRLVRENLVAHFSGEALLTPVV